MTRIRRVVIVSLLSVIGAILPITARAEAPAINHEGVGCIVVDKYPRFEARFDPAENVSRGRVRFRPTGGAHWYSVPMKQEEEAFVGVLPKPTKKLKSLDYYVEVTATDFTTGRTQEYVPEVVAGIGACQGDKITAGSLGSASIILEVPPGAPAVPAGFSSVGVISATAAAATAATAAAAGVAAGAGGGLSTTALVVGGVVIAGGAAAAVTAGAREPDAATLDNDGDGYTPEQGDCNDRSAAVRPGGGIEYQESGFPLGLVSCGPTDIPVRRVLMNNSCETLTSISQCATFRQTCERALASGSSPPECNSGFGRSSSIPPGGQVEVTGHIIALGGACTNVPCSQFPPFAGLGASYMCTVQWDTVITTSGGTASAQWSYTYDLMQCPANSIPSP
jgi:hypothetical protein